MVGREKETNLLSFPEESRVVNMVREERNGKTVHYEEGSLQNSSNLQEQSRDAGRGEEGAVCSGLLFGFFFAGYVVHCQVRFSEKRC